MTDDDGLSLDQATGILRDAVAWSARNGGITCPCCNRHVQVYKRTINSGMAVSMIKMWKAVEDGGWQHVPTTVGGRSREEGKLAYWGLLEEATEKRDDGGRAGWWRLTARGRWFVTDRLTVPRYAIVFNKRCRELAGEPFSIRDALANKFNYDTLMKDLP